MLSVKYADKSSGLDYMRYRVGTWVYFVMITVGCDLLNSTSRINIDFEAAGLSLSSISPSSGISSGGTSVTLRGSGFDSSASVYIGDTLCDSISLVSSETLTCETPAHAIGTVDVVVLQGDDNASILEDGFTYLSTVPTITSVNPSAGALAGGNIITLSGTNFFAGATVDVGGNNCGTVIVLSTTSLTCVAPAHIAATVDVTITNTNTESATALNSYTYQAAPTVTSVLPTAGALAGATAITITGTGFLAGATATVGGNNCGGLNVVNATTITCTTSAHAAGTVDIIVTNSDTQSGTGNNLYTYQAAPTVTSVLPTAGALGGATAITITGMGFLAGATATVGGNACGGLNVVNATTITCTTAAHAAGTVNIVVTNSDTQSGTGNNLYTFQAAPTVTSVLPTAGALAGATAITITGTGFLAGATATVGGNNCGGLNVVNATTITCTTAAHAAGTVDIVVTNSDTQSGTGNNLYTFQAAPTVTSVLPTFGILAGGTSISITGTGFAAGATVTVGGSSCTSVNVVNATTITCDTPAHAAGTVDIVVTNSDTQSGTGNNLFTYSAVTVTNVNPASGGTAGGTAVTITGTGFAAGASVTFGGAACANINVANATTITCDTPAHASGAVDVVVTNLDLTSGTGTNAFTYTAAMASGSRFAGGEVTCFLLDNGRVKCWGLADYLGLETFINYGDSVGTMGIILPYVDLGAGRTAVALAGSYQHICAILDDSSLKCWGSGGDGKLGYGNTQTQGNGANEMGDNLAAVDVGTGRTATQVSAGRSHTCAVLDNGTLKCWGNNPSGELGTGDTADRGDNAGEMGDNLAAIDLGTGRTAVQVSTGFSHTCAVLDNGDLKCWGWNNRGELGQGDTDTRGDAPNELGDNLPAIDLGTGRTAQKVVTPWTYTCALLDNGSVKCWGLGGALGLGDNTDRGSGPGEMGDNLPTVDLGTGRTAVDISGGVSTFVCALLDNATVKCWGGAGSLGQGTNVTLGDNAGEMGDNLPAIDLGTGRTAQAIHAGSSHACALLDDDTIKCWGNNFNGELGIESLADKGNAPGQMGDNLPVVNLGWPDYYFSRFLGGTNMCFILIGGGVKCWGNAGFGQLGYEDTVDRGDNGGEMGAALPYVDLGTGRTAVSLSGVDAVSCAILDNSTLKCWGNNFSGQLGKGHTNNLGDGAGEMGDNLTAIDLGTGRTPVQVSAGANHICAVLDNGDLKCWGSNASGVLGLEDTNNRGDGANEMGDNLPAVDLGTGRTAVQVSVGWYHTCVILDDGTLKCWGSNGFGELGYEDGSSRGGNLGDMGDNLPTIDLGTGRTAVKVSTGNRVTCAILDNHDLKCWGRGRYIGNESLNSIGANVGDMGDNLTPIDLGTGRTAYDVSTTFNHTCALRDNNTAVCWGDGNFGALGTESMAWIGDTPNTMGDFLAAIDFGTNLNPTVIFGGYWHSCALLDDESVKCFGWNIMGELGLEDTNDRGDEPNEMGDNLPAVSLE